MREVVTARLRQGVPGQAGVALPDARRRRGAGGGAVQRPRPPAGARRRAGRRGADPCRRAGVGRRCGGRRRVDAVASGHGHRAPLPHHPVVVGLDGGRLPLVRPRARRRACHPAPGCG
nr:hypothetical protein [Angustibacter aerolatus]